MLVESTAGGTARDDGATAGRGVVGVAGIGSASSPRSRREVSSGEGKVMTKKTLNCQEFFSVLLILLFTWEGMS